MDLNRCIARVVVHQACEQLKIQSIKRRSLDPYWSNGLRTKREYSGDRWREMEEIAKVAQRTAFGIAKLLCWQGKMLLIFSTDYNCW